MRFKLGLTGSLSRKMEEQDIDRFAVLSGDRNPLHISGIGVENSPFEKQLCHGMFVASLISCVIGMEMPGPGAVYLGQTLRFIKPVYVDDTITATVEVVGIREEKRILSLHTSVWNQRDELVVDGDAVVKLLDLT